MQRNPFLSRPTSNTETGGLPERAASIAPAPAWHGWLIAALPVVLLLPLIGSAFRIDDPLYLWAARQIQAHPLDPYGFDLNWYGWVEPYSTIMKNPPLVFYYIALITPLIGWSEQALHLAFLIPTFLLGLGTYRLAGRFCASPAVAALAALLTPVLFVSSVTVMCDVFMTALFIWSVHYWVKGLDGNNHRLLAVASLLIPLAALSKYFGVALIPLLAAYALIRTRRIGPWMLHFILPIAALAVYQLTTAQLYGRGLLLDAASFSSNFQIDPEYKLVIPRFYTAFSFTGACVASVALLAWRLWSARDLLIGAIVVLVCYLLIASTVHVYPWTMDDGASYTLITAQFAFWMAAGLSLCALTVLDLRQRRDADSLLLALWVGGTLLFAGYVNWITNSRALLPIIVPAGILVARRLESRCPRPARLLPWTAAPLALAAALSFCVAWADARVSDAARLGAEATIAKYSPRERAVWFRGHWGFQYYMEQLGGKAQDLKRPEPFGPHDVLVIPTINADRGDIRPPEWARIQEVVSLPSSRWITTMGYGAGFYADYFGPIPYTFVRVPLEEFAVIGVKQELFPPASNRVLPKAD